jgi:hypothetical protein
VASHAKVGPYSRGHMYTERSAFAWMHQLISMRGSRSTRASTVDLESNMETDARRAWFRRAELVAHQRP